LITFVSASAMTNARGHSERGAPALDVQCGDVGQHHVAEDGDEAPLDARAVAAHRGGLARAVLLAVAQPLAGGLREAHAAMVRSRSGRALARLLQHVVEPVIGGPFGEVAGGRTAAAAPRRADLPLDLGAVRRAVLGVPDRAALALDSIDVART
jgi:hypothetical protein